MATNLAVLGGHHTSKGQQQQGASSELDDSTWALHAQAFAQAAASAPYSLSGAHSRTQCTHGQAFSAAAAGVAATAAVQQTPPATGAAQQPSGAQGAPQSHESPPQPIDYEPPLEQDKLNAFWSGSALGGGAQPVPLCPNPLSGGNASVAPTCAGAFWSAPGAGLSACWPALPPQTAGAGAGGAAEPHTRSPPFGSHLPAQLPSGMWAGATGCAPAPSLGPAHLAGFDLQAPFDPRAGPMNLGLGLGFRGGALGGGGGGGRRAPLQKVRRSHGVRRSRPEDRRPDTAAAALAADGNGASAGSLHADTNSCQQQQLQQPPAGHPQQPQQQPQLESPPLWPAASAGAHWADGVCVQQQQQQQQLWPQQAQQQRQQQHGSASAMDGIEDLDTDNDGLDGLLPDHYLDELDEIFNGADHAAVAENLLAPGGPLHAADGTAGAPSGSNGGSALARSGGEGGGGALGEAEVESISEDELREILLSHDAPQPSPPMPER